MRKILPLLVLLLPSAALAHVGHLDEVDGHAHYLAAWALIGAIGGSAWLVWTEMRRKSGTPKRPEDDEAGA